VVEQVLKHTLCLGHLFKVTDDCLGHHAAPMYKGYFPRLLG
jgi:hypothetical protein